MPNQKDAELKSGAGGRLFAAGNTADEETQRESPSARAQAPEGDNFSPSAATQLSPVIESDGQEHNFRPDAATRMVQVAVESSPGGKQPPPAPRTEMRSLGELGTSGQGMSSTEGFAREAPTRLTTPLSDASIELSFADAELVAPAVEPTSQVAREATQRTVSPPHAAALPSDPPPLAAGDVGVHSYGDDPQRHQETAEHGLAQPSEDGSGDEDSVEILHAELPPPGAPKLPTGFIDRARLTTGDEDGGPRPVPVAPPGQRGGAGDAVANPFRAAATTVDARSLSDDEPALSELDVEVDDSLLAGAPDLPPPGPEDASADKHNPLTSDEDRVPTQNIRLELEQEMSAEQERRRTFEAGAAPPPTWDHNSSEEGTIDIDHDDAPDEHTDSFPPLRRATEPPARSDSPTAIMPAPLADDDDGDVGIAPQPRTQADVAIEESEVGPPEVARWKVIPTAWGDTSASGEDAGGLDTPAPVPLVAEPAAPQKLKTVMWNLEESAAAGAPEVTEARRYKAAAHRTATEGSAAIAATYLGECLNHLEEINALQNYLEIEQRRLLNAKVFAAQQKLRRALDLLGAHVEEDRDR